MVEYKIENGLEFKILVSPVYEKVNNQREGRGIMGKRRERGKQRNTNRGLMCTDNVGDRLWEWGGRSRGEQWGKRWDNCN